MGRHCYAHPHRNIKLLVKKEAAKKAGETKIVYSAPLEVHTAGEVLKNLSVDWQSYFSPILDSRHFRRSRVA